LEGGRGEGEYRKTRQKGEDFENQNKIIIVNPKISS
jgi:hypothetical protein